MNQEIFADAISAIHVTGNLVRIDLMAMQPHLKSDNGQPVVDISKRIIMPLEGFMQSLAVQDNIVKQLIEAGVVKKAGDAQQGTLTAVNGVVNKVGDAQQGIPTIVTGVVNQVDDVAEDNISNTVPA